MSVDTLEMHVVYDHPLDFPEHIVVVRWKAHVGWIERCEPAQLFADVEAARAALPAGLYRVPRIPGEDLKILETWL